MSQARQNGWYTGDMSPQFFGKFHAISKNGRQRSVGQTVQKSEAQEHGFLHPDQVRESVILLSLDKHGGVNAFLLKTHNFEFLAL